MGEPVLTMEDWRIWSQWERTALQWAKGSLHARRVATASDRVRQSLAEADGPVEVAWSAGKDSTALVALVAETCAADGVQCPPVMSIKDDLDFPGEEEYLRSVADRLDIPLTIVRPSASLEAFVRDHASAMVAGDDIHGRRAPLSAAHFYATIAAHDAATGARVKMLGLRAEESTNRRRNRAFNGWRYTRRDGMTVVQPICDWRSVDVFAYLLSREIDVLSVYRCVRLHDDPGRVRKSWWLPGASAIYGQTVWLRTYYPSLFQRLCEMLPHHRRLS